MAKTQAAEDKPAFDVSLTDKRNDKRVITDFVFAERYAPELLDRFAPYADAIRADLAEIDANEDAVPVNTPVDTLIAQLSEKLVARYDGEYADYAYKGKGASFFLPKNKRATKSPEEKAKDIVEHASPEQLEALAALFAERGIAVPTA